MHYDNHVAIDIISNPMFHERIEHIKVVFILFDKVKSGIIITIILKTISDRLIQLVQPVTST